VKIVCPTPGHEAERITLAEGGGGRATQALLDELIRPALSNPALDEEGDAARLDLTSGKLAFTTDSFVVSPLFFPGGDIGSLAIHGTVNDLAVSGARPVAVSAALILEEGLERGVLERVLTSMRRAADDASVSVVAGDTKVVERGRGDGVFITTSGVGVREHDLSPSAPRAGDHVLVSGDLGRHGIAILSAREQLVEIGIESDSACLWPTVRALFDSGAELRTLRDLTRGGLAAALHELARSAQVAVEIDDRSLPVHETVRGACELCGFDPVHLANEGRLVAFVAPGSADRALEALRVVDPSAARIGQVTDGVAGRVTRKSALGVPRVLDLPSGELLPRIC
jgi:hydrogenase expression/formation protein HypE